VPYKAWGAKGHAKRGKGRIWLAVAGSCKPYSCRDITSDTISTRDNQYKLNYKGNIAMCSVKAST